MAPRLTGVKRMKHSIVTVTLNPSIDVTLWVDGLDNDRVNRVQDELRQAGGKGVNVARVTGKFGIRTRCIAVAGRDNATELQNYLSEEDLLCELLPVDGAVRENITLRCDNDTVKINRQGPTLYSKMGAVLPAWVESRLTADCIAVFAGSLPAGVSVGQYGDMMIAAKKVGARVAVDTDAFTLADYARVSPWLIKPNMHELAKLSGRPCDSPEQALATAREVREKTHIPHVLVSMGAFGLVYCGEAGEYFVKAPQVTAKSTVGAGDSLLAGFLVGVCKEKSLIDCLKLAVACGSDCVQQEGTALADHVSALSLQEQVVCESV